MTENNTVYGFGDNSDCQLGQSAADTLYSNVPVKITKFNNKIIQISAGSYHTAVLIGYSFVYYFTMCEADGFNYFFTRRFNKNIILFRYTKVHSFLDELRQNAIENDRLVRVTLKPMNTNA